MRSLFWRILASFWLAIALVAGLSISAPAERLDAEWLPKIRATALEISTGLGYKPEAAYSL